MPAELGALADLIDAATDRGLGIYVQPLIAGQPYGGMFSETLAPSNGWLVGWIASGSGDELAFAPTLPEAVDAALEAWKR